MFAVRGVESFSIRVLRCIMYRLCIEFIVEYVAELIRQWYSPTPIMMGDPPIIEVRMDKNVIYL
jgi:hypothetical protein